MGKTIMVFLRLSGAEDGLIGADDDSDEASRFRALDIAGLNDAFVDYLNFSRYPEAVFSQQPRRQAEAPLCRGGEVVRPSLG